MNETILVVDDEADIRHLVQGILEDEGYKTLSCGTSEKAYDIIETQSPSLIILDIWLQGSAEDGMEILKKTQKIHPYIPVLMISGHGNIETAVAAIKEGAYDFIEKPFKSDRLLLMIRRALEISALKQENANLRAQSGGGYDDAELAGHSNAIEKLRQIIEKAAPTNSRVLLTGEAGTGKNVVARIIHRQSDRADKSFMVVNCATLDPERLEIELFGSAKGKEKKVGLLEQAKGGTLLLDEIADMSMPTQAKIVRVLQEQRIKKAGEQEFTSVDVRILATTNKNLIQAINDGQFREDLYYRLNVVPLELPPLRERTADISALIESFIATMAPGFGIENVSFDQTAIQKLKHYKWPGNVRQLRNVVEWVLIMHGNNAGKPYTCDQLPVDVISGHVGEGQSISSASSPLDTAFVDLPLRDAREAFERLYLLSQIQRFDGNISKTAQFVGMERSALHRKIKSLGVAEDKVTEETVRKRA